MVKTWRNSRWLPGGRIAAGDSPDSVSLEIGGDSRPRRTEGRTIRSHDDQNQQECRASATSSHGRVWLRAVGGVGRSITPIGGMGCWIRWTRRGQPYARLPLI
jgi:hypothetical protein